MFNYFCNGLNTRYFSSSKPSEKSPLRPEEQLLGRGWRVSSGLAEHPQTSGKWTIYPEGWKTQQRYDLLAFIFVLYFYLKLSWTSLTWLWCFGITLEQTFDCPSCLKNDTTFKSGQKWLKNNNISRCINYKSLTHEIIRKLIVVSKRAADIGNRTHCQQVKLQKILNGDC